MKPEEKLKVWNSRWGLEGAFIICRQCCRRQAKADWDSSFAHATDCISVSKNQIPWREINEIKQGWEYSLKYSVTPRIPRRDK